MTKESAHEIISRVRKYATQFAELRVGVIGDICLDHICFCDERYSEESCETGMMTTAVLRTRAVPGGGGNVANNLKSLGAGTVEALGVTGDDGHGYLLRKALERAGVDISSLINDPQRQTHCYTKFLDSNQNMREYKPRVDFLNTKPPSKVSERDLSVRLEAAVKELDGIVVVDQQEQQESAVITPELRQCLLALAAQHKRCLFAVDSRRRLAHYRNMIVKPNYREAVEVFGGDIEQKDRAEAVANFGFELQSRFGGKHPLFVTLDAEGVVALDSEHIVYVPTLEGLEVADICGAGDSFMAAMLLTLCACKLTYHKLDIGAAAMAGNCAAAVSIAHEGTYAVSQAEFLAMLERYENAGAKQNR